MSVDLVRMLGQPSGLADPYSIYRALRDADPVLWVPFQAYDGGQWFVTRYDLVDQVLRHPKVWKNTRRMNDADEDLFSRTMLFQDPPEHTRLRGLVNRAFTPGMVDRLGPRIDEIIADLLDAAADRGKINFIADFALPLPVIVIAEILGVPPNDRARFREWSRSLIVTGEGGGNEGGTRDASPYEGAMARFAEYFDGLIRTKRAHPGPDLLSTLVAMEDQGDRLSRDELLGMCILLLVAGHETTVNLLGNGLSALLTHSSEMVRLRSDPSLIEPAVEEMLRFDPPVQVATYRFIGEAMTLGGKTLLPGQSVAAVLAAANRDPSQFPDPDRFDVGRTPNRHLAFGRGIHYCLGAPLARLEARRAWRGLLARFSAVEMDGEVVRRPNPMFRGFDDLPVRLY